MQKNTASKVIDNLFSSVLNKISQMHPATSQKHVEEKGHFSVFIQV